MGVSSVVFDSLVTDTWAIEPPPQYQLGIKEGLSQTFQTSGMAGNKETYLDDFIYLNFG